MTAPRRAVGYSGPGDAVIDPDQPIPYRLAEHPPSSPRLKKCAPASEYKPTIDRFAALMLEKCVERSKRHGDSWRATPVREHLSWMRRELAELEEAVDRLEFSACDPEEELMVLRRMAVMEAVDVANLAAFVANSIGMDEWPATLRR